MHAGKVVAKVEELTQRLADSVVRKCPMKVLGMCALYTLKLTHHIMGIPVIAAYFW